MNRKFLWFFVFMFIILGTFAAASADQDGRDSWCNIDEYGCWVTNEDDGKTYIMFWSEEARQYIMGAGSPPYKLVVRHPGYTGRLRLESIAPKPAATAIPTVTPPAPEEEETQEPTELEEATQDPCVGFIECIDKFDGFVGYICVDGERCYDSYTAYKNNYCEIEFPGCIK